MTKSRPSWPPSLHASSTESYLDVVERDLDPAVAAWVRSLVERIEPIRQRDIAIRAAAELVAASSVSGRAKALEHELNKYLGFAWIRGERDLASPPIDVSPLRRELWRIARLTGGEGLAWRRILEIIEK